ncbi:hypothetical protein DVR12_03640 [Chitinophaga silvatica]|uniref:Uncharacterized protein n=1 Tax=Chitinophaga silvatica TaxID=2282649 RepID=A0A3E1YHR6_9BACT|nr:hypothetical protein [Chitinophaga silvatica]RFS26888.1 hypothetical protein DVR12_03640 [Chitinophaga silvatica]
MIFLSAQPDSPVFVWQLQILLRNLNYLGVPKLNIHVLFGYNPYKGIEPLCREFIKEYNDIACFFSYPDIRDNKFYVSSIRPHIVKQHYSANKIERHETVFYHDSDIYFTRLPRFDDVEDDNTWYVSDTKSYLDTKYIRKHGEYVLDDMCKIVGIDKSTVISNDENAGGAQYLIRNVDYEFWNKVQRDSERLFSHLLSNEQKYASLFAKENAIPVNEYKYIQAWCSDMWAVLWNGLFYGHKIRISKEMEFSWPTSDVHEWNQMCIYHDSGILESDSDKYFYKGSFKENTPIHNDWNHLRSDSCSAKYANEISAAGNNTFYKLDDAVFVILVETDISDNTVKLDIFIRFITRYFQTNILVIEIGSVQRLVPEKWEINISYEYYNNLSTLRSSNWVRKFNNEILIFHDLETIISPYQLYSAACLIRHKVADLVIPFDSGASIIANDKIETFSKETDIRILNTHNSKTTTLNNLYGGNTYLITTELFIKGEYNSFLFSSNLYNELSRISRAKVLGFKVKKIKGKFFIWNDQRVLNNVEESSEILRNSQTEALELIDYIHSNEP